MATPISLVTSVARISPQRSRRRRDISGCDSTVTIASRARASRPSGVWYQDRPIVSLWYRDSSTRHVVTVYAVWIFFYEKRIALQPRICTAEIIHEIREMVANNFIGYTRTISIRHVLIGYGFRNWLDQGNIDQLFRIWWILSSKKNIRSEFYVIIVVCSLKTNVSDERRHGDSQIRIVGRTLASVTSANVGKYPIQRIFQSNWEICVCKIFLSWPVINCTSDNFYQKT